MWNKIIDYQNEKSNKPVSEPIDVSDVSNVEQVESKLGQPMKITQKYLLKYTTNKSGIWYMSSAKVNKISNVGEDSFITFISDDGKYKLVGSIAKDKVDFKKGDFVNFVGTIDFVNHGINLTTISKDKIDFKDVENIEFEELTKNIEAVLNNQFVINGYMVTDNEKYKIYENKTAYKNNNKVGTYFTLEWKDSFNLTGNALVTVQCYIGDTYVLKDCELLQ